jgi:hypothetical protein
MRIRRTLLLLLSLAVLSTGVSFAGDLDVGALFDGAKAAYGEKRYGKSLADLRLLVSEVGRARAAQLLAALPAAPAGWTAEPVVEDDSAPFAFITLGLAVQRRYAKGDARVKVELVADSPLLATFSRVLTNPAFLAPNQKVVEVKGRKALLETDDEAKRAVLRLLLQGDATMLSVEGEGVAKADVSETFANALDLDRLEKALRE